VIEAKFDFKLPAAAAFGKRVNFNYVPGLRAVSGRPCGGTAHIQSARCDPPLTTANKKGG
jgi:hypothetical protein